MSYFSCCKHSAELWKQLFSKMCFEVSVSLTLEFFYKILWKPRAKKLKTETRFIFSKKKISFRSVDNWIFADDYLKIHWNILNFSIKNTDFDCNELYAKHVKFMTTNSIEPWNHNIRIVYIYKKLKKNLFQNSISN